MPVNRGARLILRIEDTDRTRFVDDAEKDILSSMEWAGIMFDEGPHAAGKSGPYRQSERLGRYRAYADQLVESGNAYIAFDTPAEIETMRQERACPENPNPRYGSDIRNNMSNSLSLPASEVQQRLDRGEDYVVRLKADPGRLIAFQDMVRGKVLVDSVNVDDQVLMKSDGFPTYHMANVVDDHEMRITHVIRGEEWLPSTPKHVLLYEAFGWSVPKMAHLPLILSPTGGKLSKRSADRAGIPVSVRDYVKGGYEPEALINFLALLGWNPGDDEEHFDMAGLVERFSIDRIGQAGVQFDLAKLKWHNEYHLRRQSASVIARSVRPLLSEARLDVSDERLVDGVELMRERISFASDLLVARYLFEDPRSYDEKGLKKRWKEDSPDLVSAYASAIESRTEVDATAYESILRAITEGREIGAGRLIHPARLAVSGVVAGPGLFELLEYLGKETVVRRLRTAVRVLSLSK